MRRSRFIVEFSYVFTVVKFTINFHYEAATRLWRMICCWQLGFIISLRQGWRALWQVLAFSGGLFERLGNVLDSKGLAFLVKS
ncbi:MAG: hypothetical protein DRI89_07310 [Bacteroidetes bacterium]|nr:MAG: hypothetical protein DRI89_07310 [Bacteroidota bacterium]